MSLCVSDESLIFGRSRPIQGVWLHPHGHMIATKFIAQPQNHPPDQKVQYPAHVLVVEHPTNTMVETAHLKLESEQGFGKLSIDFFLENIEFKQCKLLQMNC
jgi:hypothetical protein